jgi:hypothetical protein
VRLPRERGVPGIKGASGGITAWSDEIDRNVPGY